MSGKGKSGSANAGFEMVILTGPTRTQEDFDEFAKAAQKAGATHIYISDLVRKSRWEIDDPKDPYLQWAIPCPTFFKAAPPEGIKGTFVPEDYAREYMDALKKRSKALERLGLKAVFRANEPFWISEAVYQEHPEWRGPRCDHPRRSLHPRFAPCIDQPEVLDLYRRSAGELFKNAPTIGIVTMLTNDCSSGICWSERLYNNANGPAWCRGRDMGERVAGFLGALIAGAQDAGVEADFYFSKRSFTTQADLVERSLKSHMGFLDTGGPDIPPISSAGIGGFPPVIGISQPITLLEGLERAYKAGQKCLSLSIGGGRNKEDLAGVQIYLKVLKRFLKSPTDGYWSRLSFLYDIATEEVGEEDASTLMELWEDIRRGLRDLVKGLLRALSVVTERWLTRPLVPFPLELPPEDRDYYRKHQFQATTEEDAADLLNSQGSRRIDGYVHAVFAGSLLGTAQGHFSRAAELAAELSGAGESFKRLEQRLRAAICIMRTMNNVHFYQTLLDRRKEELKRLEAAGIPGVEEPPYPAPGDPDRQQMYSIVRSEIDNTHGLIKLLERCNFPVIHMAESKEEEDTFTLGPDLTDQMRHKIKTMMAHWLDYNRLWPRPNR